MYETYLYVWNTVAIFFFFYINIQVDEKIAVIDRREKDTLRIYNASTTMMIRLHAATTAVSAEKYNVNGTPLL